MAQHSPSYQSLPFPKLRRLMVDGGRIGRQKHLVHGLVEIDVTEARRLIHAHKEKTGETLSFTAFITACLGRAIDLNKHMHAYRAWGERLIIFDEVDVNTMFEVEMKGRKIIRPHILRAVNKKTLRNLHAEIRAFQAGHASGREGQFIGWFVLLPGFIRHLFFEILFSNPHWLKELNGTVSLTSIGMFGNGGGWGIPVSNHTLQITLGGIIERPALINGQLMNREHLCVTVSFDHDVVDGAPAARFVQRLKELIENCYGLVECTAESSVPAKTDMPRPLQP